MYFKAKRLCCWTWVQQVVNFEFPTKNKNLNLPPNKNCSKIDTYDEWKILNKKVVELKRETGKFVKEKMSYSNWFCFTCQVIKHLSCQQPSRDLWSPFSCPYCCPFPYDLQKCEEHLHFSGHFENLIVLILIWNWRNLLVIQSSEIYFCCFKLFCLWDLGNQLPYYSRLICRMKRL